MEVVELWQHCNEEIIGYLYKAAGNIDIAEDIASEVFMKALKYQNTLAGLSLQQCRSWLYTTAKRKFIDYVRSKKTGTPISQTSDYVEDDLSVVVVDELIAKLPDEMQELVAMRYFAGMDSVLIGKTLGIPAATVRGRLRKACALLRKYWKQN